MCVNYLFFPQFQLKTFFLHQVGDVNDNAPQFVNRPYYAAVQVEAEPGSAIFRVSAVDLDYGLNGEVTYSFKEQQGNFQVRARAVAGGGWTCVC